MSVNILSQQVQFIKSILVVGYIQNQQKKQSRGIFLLFYFLYKNKTEVPIRMIHECTSHCTKYLVQINNGPACIFLRNSCTLYAVILLLHIQYSHLIGLLYLHTHKPRTLRQIGGRKICTAKCENAKCGVIYIKQMGECFVLIKKYPQSVKTQSAGPQRAGFMCICKISINPIFSILS